METKEVVKEVARIQYVLVELGMVQNTPTELRCNNCRNLGNWAIKVAFQISSQP
jgi:hypothetical protein